EVKHIVQALDADLAGNSAFGPDLRRLSVPRETVDEIEQREQNTAHEQHGAEHVLQRPQEVDAGAPMAIASAALTSGSVVWGRAWLKRSSAVARRRRVVVGGQAARALPQRLLQGQGPLVLAQEVGKSLVGKSLEILATIPGQQKQSLPDRGPEFDQLAFGVAAARRAKHIAP